MAETRTRPLVQYDFEGGGSILISVSGDVPTERAIEMAESLLKIKRDELRQRAAQQEPGNGG